MDDYALAAAQFEKAVEHLNDGRFAEALALLDKLLVLKPGLEEAHSARGNALYGLNRPLEALRSFDRAIAIDPQFAEAYNNKAIALQKVGRQDEALQNSDHAIRLKPDLPDGHNTKGTILRALGRTREARQSFRRAIAIQPMLAEAWYNEGLALQDLERPQEAIDSFQQAIVLAPNFAEAHSDLGVAFLKIGRLDDARRSFDAAISLNPARADAYWSKAIYLLLTGQFEAGWPLYEWRKRRFKTNTPESFAQPAWLGDQDIEGRTIFIRFEQGLGDTIQFCRYVPLMEAKGARVILSVQDSLVSLLDGLSPTATVVGAKTIPAQFDYHTTLLSLPLAFKTRLDTIPVAMPYLRADAKRVLKWKARIGDAGYKIGISWQGNAQSEIDAGRSFALDHFAALCDVSGIRLISLQKNEGAEQLQRLPANMKVETLGVEFDAGPDAFLDTAAVMENLDLVVTSDTAIAHLAGSLARPVWVATRYMPDWRWLLDRMDSPWYPTMRLFRQPARGDWHSVFGEMRAALTERLS